MKNNHQNGPSNVSLRIMLVIIAFAQILSFQPNLNKK